MALGGEDRLIGVDTTSQHPASLRALPSIGYQRQLAAEGILSLRPDLLLGSEEMGPPPVLEQLRSAGVRHIALADVYGSDPAGGNALAISRAIDWLVARNVQVVSISLVGPRNALLGQAIAAGRRRGVVFIAPVGNDGPAAPPAYPASYAGVLAITGVDGRNRALIEAGQALHLDYASPGADMVAGAVLASTSRPTAVIAASRSRATSS